MQQGWLMQVVSDQSILGGNNLYITGVTIRVRMREEISPPMMTHAKGEYKGECSRTNGMSPPIAIRVVNTIGMKRDSPAFSIA